VYFLYSFITLLALVALSPYLAYQALRHGKFIGGLGERLGSLPSSLNAAGDESIWIHAVSVGEVLAAAPLIAELRQRYPQLRLFLSTTTLTGQRLARQGAVDVDGVLYFPVDWAFCVRRTLNRLTPRLFVMIDTEIWPNLLRECRRRGIPTMLANGRLSSRSFPRYRMIRPLFRHVLADVDRLCVQGGEAASRFEALGADPASITVAGSLKFDALDAVHAPGIGGARVLRFFRMSANRPVLVAGSTLQGEEAAVIRAFNRVRAGGGRPLLVLAARHPERFAEVERLCVSEGLSTVRRTDLPIDAEPPADVVVLDTIGELADVYQIATVVFVGGSLVRAGGHNILEPAAFGKPVVVGPHMDNFAEIAETFLSNDAAVQVQSDRDLESTIAGLMGDPVRRAKLGAAARALVDTNRGAKDRTLAVVAQLLPPEDRRAAVVHPFRVRR
jgi:3-deoxy-D-manno-octulosonic-acid transferase